MRMVDLESHTVLTIGHSTHTYERFVELARNAAVTAIADVRSSPYSRHFPQFNMEDLKDKLRGDGIAYVFLGLSLGGRPRSATLYSNGIADYEKMAKTADFQQGLERVIEGAKKYRIALMCSEHDPIDCHRCLLVARALKTRNVMIQNILSNGQMIAQSAIEDRLLELADDTTSDFFASDEERIAKAYRNRAQKVAFVETPPPVNKEASNWTRQTSRQ